MLISSLSDWNRNTKVLYKQTCKSKYYNYILYYVVVMQIDLIGCQKSWVIWNINISISVFSKYRKLIIFVSFYSFNFSNICIKISGECEKKTFIVWLIQQNLRWTVKFFLWIYLKNVSGFSNELHSMCWKALFLSDFCNELHWVDSCNLLLITITTSNFSSIL